MLSKFGAVVVEARKKYQQVGFIFAAVTVLFMIELIKYIWPASNNIPLWSDIHGLVSGLLAFAILIWVIQIASSEIETKTRLAQLEALQADMKARQDALFRITRQFAEANDEGDVIEHVLRVSLDLTHADGASFVPFDDRGHPQAAVSRGELPSGLLDSWTEHLAKPEVRAQCSGCKEYHANDAHSPTCPMLRGPLLNEYPQIHSVYCLPLRCGEHDLGMLTIYLPADKPLDSEHDTFLHTIVDEMALGLESIRLRKRELLSLQQLQTVREKTDLNLLLTDLVDNLRQSLKADFAQMLLVDAERGNSRKLITRGELSEEAHAFTDGILFGAYSSGKSIFLGDVLGVSNGKSNVQAILAAALHNPDETSVGAILVGHRVSQTFTRRQLSLLETIARQVSLVVKNANLVNEVEYKAIVEERNRLAREIHDGIAQNLGFIKLQVFRMMNALKQKEYERLESELGQLYKTVSTSYTDVRDSIDDLRLKPGDGKFSNALNQLVQDFKEKSGIPVYLTGPEVLDQFPPEMQSQTIRIVQEAVSNVRKHAHAKQVWINTRMDGGNEIVLEIRDDGVGFTPEEVSSLSQYGLVGMQERADLMGADFQVISSANQGTCIRVSFIQPIEDRSR